MQHKNSQNSKTRKHSKQNSKFDSEMLQQLQNYNLDVHHIEKKWNRNKEIATLEVYEFREIPLK